MPITSVSTVATGDTITASLQNTMRDNDLVLDARTGGDPGASGRIAISNGATSTAWAALNALTVAIQTTQMVTALGFQAGASGVHGGAGGVNAGSGPLSGGTKSNGVPKVLGLEVGATGIDLDGPIDGGTKAGGTIQVQGALIGSNGLDSDGLISSDSTVSGFQLVASVDNGSSPPLVINANQANVTVPNLKAATAANALAIADGAVSTTAKLADGVVTSAKILDGTIVAGDIADATITAAKIVPGTLTTTQIADGTIIADDIAAAHKSGSANVESLRQIGTGALQAAAGNHTHANMALSASGAYTGNGSATRNITVGFAPKKVTIIRTDIPTMWTSMGDAVSIQHNVGTSNGSVAGLTFGATTFQVTTTSGTNTNLGTYIWVAEG